MPDRIRRTERIWMYGTRYEFNVYESSQALHQLQYRHNARGNPVSKQKNQVVLHYTAGNNPAQNTIRYWSQHAPVPHRWVCIRYFNVPGCNWHTAHGWSCPVAGCALTGDGRNWYCPVHGRRRQHRCPHGHGARQKGRVRASSQYIVERAHDRLNRAQPYSDVVEVIDSEFVAYHGGIVNDNSIGIEIANVGWNFRNARHEGPMNGAGAARRPTDHNRWLHVANPGAFSSRARPSNLRHNDFQAYQEEQYLTLILLLRSLSIKHRIARRFLGENANEKMMRWWHNLPASSVSITRSKLMRFRGILSHMNCHDGKECGGPALHRNRIFRGIIDEWWMPVQLDGTERPYYMGPFDLQAGVPSYFRWRSGRLNAELFRDANVYALQDTKSYYDFDKTEWYYAFTETAHTGGPHGIGAGTFPIGKNKLWHGGIHLEPPDGNRKVYAAASGKIVSARLGSNSAIENDLSYGSQRFILIRHTVYYQQEADPGGGTRINYTSDPTYFFTLYMHLDSFSDISATNNNNPPWFNYWRRRNADADANTVFCPNVEVSVGDWLGSCGRFRGRNIIHFEVMSREELTVSPWDDARYRAHDPDTNILCDAATIDSFVQDAAGDGIDTIDILQASRHLRRVKSYHKSEWALSSADDLAPVVPTTEQRTRKWNSLQHFMWVSDAISVCPDLETQLCDANGFFWHYHPITFMEFVNRLILEENGEVDEPDMRNTNVVIERGYLTRYVGFSTGAAVPEAADGERLRPYDVSRASFQYRFTRNDLACHGAGAHSPGPTPPNLTRFNLTLLNVLESIRRQYRRNIRVNTSFLCEEHGAFTPSNRNLCVLRSADALSMHSNGLAADISPSTQNPRQCRALWEAANSVIDDYNDTFDDHTGEPSRADLTEGAGQLTIATVPAIQTKLANGTALNSAEARRCIFHIELRERSHTVVWECWIRRNSRAIQVRMQSPGIIGVFNSLAIAEAEGQRDPGLASGPTWEAWIRRRTHATDVKLHDSGIIGIFNTREEAEAEKDRDFAWPSQR